MNENNDNEQTVSLEEISEVVNANILPPIEIDLGTYNQEQFFKGIDDSSYLCGQITALLNCGVSEDFVLTYILNRETIEHNIENTKLNNAAQIEISKNQKIILDKQEL